MVQEPASWRRALDELVLQLRDEFSQRVSQVILFGSRSREDARDGSDVDVAIVLSDEGDYWSDFERITRAAADVSLRYDVLISAVPVSEERLRESASPFFENIRREGVRVG